MKTSVASRLAFIWESYILMRNTVEKDIYCLAVVVKTVCTPV